MRIACPGCKREYEVPADKVGRTVRCSGCQQAFAALPPSGGEDRPRKKRDFNALMDRVLAATLAVIIHGVIFAVLIALAVAPPAEADPGTEVAIAEMPSEQLTENEEGGLAAQAPGGDSLLEEEFTLPVEVTPSPDSPDAVPIDMELAPSGGSNPGDGGLGLDALAPGGKGSGMAGGANFMGTEARGNRFCIIADRSGSMTGAKMEYVKTEVLKTLADLRGSSSFYVIFFDDRADAMPVGSWLTRRDVSRIQPWVRQIFGRGGTEPRPAFEFAFSLKPRPDVIFFMTDGLFADTVPAEVARLNTPGKNGKKVTIHTIAFADRTGEPLLRTIAEQSGGKYRYVAGIAP